MYQYRLHLTSNRNFESSMMIDHACYPINGWEHHVEMNIVTRVSPNIKCMVRSVDDMFLVTESLTVETFGQTNCMCDFKKLVLTSKDLVRWGIGNLLCKMQGT